MSVHIQVERVREASQQLKVQNQQIADVLMAMKQRIINIKPYFDSAAAVEFQNHFIQFSKRFLEMQETIEQYIQFLELTSSSYETLDASLKGNVNGMQI
jgi:hypothetical protein